MVEFKDGRWKRFYRCHNFETLLLTVEVRGQGAVYVRSGEGEGGGESEPRGEHG